MRSTYETVSRELILGNAAEFANFCSILQLVDQSQVTYKELMLISGVMPNLSLDGLRQLE